MTRRLIAFCTACLFILCFSLSASARDSVETYEDISFAIISPLESINKYSNNNDIYFDISRQLTLFNFSGEAAYTVYELTPHGYAILLNQTNGLLEASYSEDTRIPFDMSGNIQFYYGGPGVYCTFENNTFVNLYDGTQLSDDAIQKLILTETSVQDYEVQKAVSLSKDTSTSDSASYSTESTSLTYSVAYSYFSALTDYGNNINGTCTVVATQMLIGYYDYFVNDNFVDSTYEEGTGTSEEFHQLLNNYVYGNSAQDGIKIRHAAPGINSYFADQELEVVLKSEYSSRTAAINKVISTVQNGEPVIASMATLYNANYNHSVLIYSVTYDSTNPSGTAVFTMNMGWYDGTHDGQSDTEYVASASWFYECGYIESTCETHTMTSWIDIGVSYHWRNCRYCNYIEQGLHRDHWNVALNKCMACGKQGFNGSIVGPIT